MADIDSKSVKAFTSGSLAGTGDLNLTPARTIVGSNTGLSEPFGVVFGPDGRLLRRQFRLR